MNDAPETPSANEEKPQSIFGVIIHSFFIVPFLIAVFCVLLFAAMSLLTHEKQTAYDLLNDVKAGSLTKRWQAAFELSKILSRPDLIPKDERFTTELIDAFKASKHDDDRVRQYLALAMGRTGKKEFLKPLLAEINEEKEQNLVAVIYALGMLKDKAAIPAIVKFLDHPVARVRSVAIVALGQIGDKSVVEKLKNALNDAEPNVQWGTAISLAYLGDNSGEEVLKKLLNRSYLSQFPEVDSQEQNQLILEAIKAAKKIHEPSLEAQIFELSKNAPNMTVRAAAMDYSEGKNELK